MRKTFKGIFGLCCVVIFLGAPSLSFAKEGTFSEMKLHNYLKSQQNKNTGLLSSFSRTSDKDLENQAATYDQALSGIAFLLLDDVASAEKILKFFYEKWDGKGFANFYNAETGGAGIETTVHLGPNAWIGIFAVQHSILTRSTKYLGLAENILLWTSQLNQKRGGFAMGPRRDWAADWSEVYSSENNLSLYGFFHLLTHSKTDAQRKKLANSGKKGIKNFLQKVAYGQRPDIRVGLNNFVTASDIAALSVLAIAPSELASDVGITADEVLQIAREQFFVETDGIIGYDFTDEENIKSIGRDRMISLEWTAMFILAYQRISQYYRQLFKSSQDTDHQTRAAEYSLKGKELLQNFDKMTLNMGRRRIAYPYATKGFTQVFPFGPWWKTPANGADGQLAASLSSTCWRLFVSRNFNPFMH